MQKALLRIVNQLQRKLIIFCGYITVCDLYHITHCHLIRVIKKLTIGACTALRSNMSTKHGKDKELTNSWGKKDNAEGNQLTVSSLMNLITYRYFSLVFWPSNSIVGFNLHLHTHIKYSSQLQNFPESCLISNYFDCIGQCWVELLQCMWCF